LGLYNNVIIPENALMFVVCLCAVVEFLMKLGMLIQSHGHPAHSVHQSFDLHTVHGKTMNKRGLVQPPLEEGLGLHRPS